MSATSHLKAAFLSGTAETNLALLDLFAKTRPDLPLCVVAEFEPPVGEWIPWHVMRPLRQNVEAVRAALDGRTIETACMVYDRRSAHRKMRAAARILARGALIAYDEQLRIATAGTVWRHTASPIVTPLRRWLKRMAHPSEAEIPVRARLAQTYGLLADRFRASAAEVPMAGTPLREGVTVVIPSRDGRELLQLMLPALLPLRNENYLEVIVVDNGSHDGTAAWLADHWPGVKVIHHEAPLSFARAVNAGIADAVFTHTLLLNNDMIVEPGFVEALTAAFRTVPELFSATAQIFFPPGIRREETGKAVWSGASNTTGFPVRCNEPIAGEDLTWVLYGSGGCSLFDTAKLRALGGVATEFDPAYVEDLDLGFRAWKRGWPSVFCADARAEHRHRATTSRFYTARQLDFFVERNYLRFLIHAIGSPELFRRLWAEGIRRLQLAPAPAVCAIDVLRAIPRIGLRPPLPTGHLTEADILALNNGDVAVFSGSHTAEQPASRPCVLIASPYLPFPLSHGGAVRIFNLMRQAAAANDIVLVAFCDELTTPPRPLLDLCSRIVMVRRHGSHYRCDTSRPDVVEEFESETFRACLRQAVHQFRPSIVQLEFTWMAQFADACRPARTILVEHDITFDLQEQLLATSTSGRWELEQQLAKWRAFETDAWRRVDAVVTMSAKDSQTVTGAKHVACLPNGVDCERFQPEQEEPEPRRLLFIGSFAHLPNLLALEYFLRDVWPLLTPGYTLHVIAGSRPEYYLDFHRSRVTVDLALPGIELDGFVSDVRTAYRRAQIVLAPLTASAGTNIKVLEAMAMGRAVVSTSAGVNGLAVDAVIADTPKEMAEQIELLSGNPARRHAIEKSARVSALRYDWRAVGEAQNALYDRMRDL